MLRSKGFRVYFCDKDHMVNEMVDETRPNIVYVNSRSHDESSSDIYHSIVDNVQYASIPVIYTLSENDVYLVNRKRTAIKERRYMTSSSVLEAIKMAFITTDTPPARKRVPLLYPSYSQGYTPFRA
jgi:hypothetical protein